MEFYEVVRTRRSVRAYRDDPIPEEVLRRVLEAARVAPSGSNRQPTRLILVREPDARRALAPLCGGQRFIAEAPLVAVAVAKNIHYNRGEYMGDLSMLVDGAIVVDHLTLAARAEGLGTCWIGSFDNAALKTHLGLPDDWSVVALTPIGYPKSAKAFGNPRERLAMAEFVCEEKWTFEQ